MTTVAVRGVPIRVVTTQDAVRQVGLWVAARTRTYVSCASVHLVEEAHARAEVMRALEGAGMVLADGAPVAWAASLLGNGTARRTTGSDLFDAVLTQFGPEVRHFFYGGHPRGLDRLQRQVAELYPEATIAGTLSPPFRPRTEREWSNELEAINDARPDVIWVGLGAPKQDLWMARARPALEAPVLIGVGAVFDFVSGEKRRAPKIMQSLGLEWLFRLACEPRRLLRRYAVTNTSFVCGVGLALLSVLAKGRKTMWLE